MRRRTTLAAAEAREAGAGALRLGPIAAWQAALLAAGSAILATSGRGSIPSLWAGGALMLGSLVLQRLAVSAALRRERRPGLAVLLLLLKLGAILALVYVGFQTALLGPASFAAGATSLPVAIVSDVCYLHWSSRRGRAFPP